MQIKVQQLQDTSTGLRTVKAYLVSSVFQELIRTRLLEFILTFRFPDKKVGMGCMHGYGYLSVIVVHMLFVLSSFSATASTFKKVESILGLSMLQLWSFWHGERREVHTCTHQSQWLTLLQACL